MSTWLCRAGWGPFCGRQALKAGFQDQHVADSALEIIQTQQPLAPVPGPLSAWVRGCPLSPACFVLASLGLWDHSPLPLPSAPVPKASPLSVSSPEETASRDAGAATGEGKRLSCPSLRGLYTDTIAHSLPCCHAVTHETKARNDKVIYNPDLPTNQDMLQKQTFFQRSLSFHVAETPPDATVASC